MSAYRLPWDMTRCRDDACPMRWGCLRWAPVWDSQEGGGAKSYTVGLRDVETGECGWMVTEIAQSPSVEGVECMDSMAARTKEHPQLQ